MISHAAAVVGRSAPSWPRSGVGSARSSSPLRNGAWHGPVVRWLMRSPSMLATAGSDVARLGVGFASTVLPSRAAIVENRTRPSASTISLACTSARTPGGAVTAPTSSSVATRSPLPSGRSLLNAFLNPSLGAATRLAHAAGIAVSSVESTLESALATSPANATAVASSAAMGLGGGGGGAGGGGAAEATGGGGAGGGGGAEATGGGGGATGQGSPPPHPTLPKPPTTATQATNDAVSLMATSLRSSCFAEGTRTTTSARPARNKSSGARLP